MHIRRGEKMPKRKADIEIGKRAVLELQQKFPGMQEHIICSRIGLNKKTLWEWKQGTTPDGLALQKMAFAGCDVKYILTGRRDANVKESD